MRSISFITLIGALVLVSACQRKLYSVKTAPGSSKMESLMYYRLPRTDVLLETKFVASTKTPGKYYCFGEVNRIGNGKCSEGCTAGPEPSVSVQSASIEPVTVPDRSELYVMQVPRTHCAAKRKAAVTASKTGIVSGAQGEFESYGGRIALGVIGTVMKIVAEFVSLDDPEECKQLGMEAAKTAGRIQQIEKCIVLLQDEQAAAKATRPSEIVACRDSRVTMTQAGVLTAAPKEAIRTLKAEASRLRAMFGKETKARSYAVQKLIEVVNKEAKNHTLSPAGPRTTIDLGKENGVTLCLGNDEKNPSTPPTPHFCEDSNAKKFLRVYLEPVPGSVDSEAAGTLKPPFGEGGLVYRLPVTALLHVQVMTPGMPSQSNDASAASAEKNALSSHQIKVVTIPQLGPFRRAPREIRAAKGHIVLEVSPETGMLTKVERLQQPEPMSEQANSAADAMGALAGKVAESQEEPSEADDLAEENRLLRLNIENECLKAGRTDCYDSSDDD